jgi:alpha-tubulin suppressor-like RCC1 family protein
MRRALVVAIVSVVAVLGLAPAASAGTSNADGTQPVMASGAATTCAVRETGQVYCAGLNFGGNLGRGDTQTHDDIGPTSLTKVTAVYGASMTFCATTTARHAYCWGSNSWGNAGIGTLDDSVTTPTAVVGLTNVASMALGETTTCATRQDGSVWCWGNANYGVIPGQSGFIPTPTKVSGISAAVKVAVGGAHACVIRVDRTVWCWGYNSEGQLGRGSSDDVPHLPGQVIGITDAVAIAISNWTTCVVRATGAVVCWGYAASFETGVGDQTSALQPAAVPNITGAKGVSMFGSTGCAWSATTVRCWGLGTSGQIGDGQFGTVPWPARVEFGLAAPSEVSVGGSTPCEIASGGRWWCWGSNSYAEAGTGNTNPTYQGGGPGNMFGYAADPVTVPVLNSAPGKPVAKSTVKGKASLTWTAPSTSNGTSAPTDYTVQYRLKGTTAWKTFKDAVSSSRSATVTGLTSGKYYEFRVLPKNWAGVGAASATASGIKVK